MHEGLFDVEDVDNSQMHGADFRLIVVDQSYARGRVRRADDDFLF